MENRVVTAETVKEQRRKVKNWNENFQGELHGLGPKFLSLLHSHLANHFNKMLQQRLIHDRFATIQMFLIKKGNTKETTPSNFHPNHFFDDNIQAVMGNHCQFTTTNAFKFKFIVPCRAK